MEALRQGANPDSVTLPIYEPGLTNVLQKIVQGPKVRCVALRDISRTCLREGSTRNLFTMPSPHLPV